MLSLVFLVYLPAGPAQAKWLTEDEREWIIHHLSKSATGDGHGVHLGRALLDHRVWQVSLVFLCMLTCSYAYTFSAPLILKTITALNNRDVGFLVAVMNVLGAPAMILNAMHSDRTKERYFHVVIPLLIMCRVLPDRWAVDSAISGGPGAGACDPSVTTRCKDRSWRWLPAFSMADPPPLALRR